MNLDKEKPDNSGSAVPLRTAQPAQPQKNIGNVYYANTQAGYFDACVIFFVAFLVIANICATKIIQIGPFVFDGGAVTFPLTYILGDVISEVYGFKAAKRAIKYGFIVSIMASLVFYLVGIAPIGPGYQDQDAFISVLGFVPRIVAASLCGYLFGEWLNSYVLVYLKNRYGEKQLWIRLIGSTLAGEFVDSLIFCTIAFIGIIPFVDFVNYVAVGYVYKVGVEVVFLPLTYLVIAWVKKHEPSYRPLT